MLKWMRGLAVILLGATAAHAENIKGAEAKKLVAAGALLLDVRTPEEFNSDFRRPRCGCNPERSAARSSL